MVGKKKSGRNIFENGGQDSKKEVFKYLYRMAAKPIRAWALSNLEKELSGVEWVLRVEGVYLGGEPWRVCTPKVVQICSCPRVYFLRWQGHIDWYSMH